MKRNDWLFGLILTLFAALLIIPITGQRFFAATNAYPIVGGFVKFFLFATIGDIMAARLKTQSYRVVGLLYKACVWGFIGIAVAVVFPIFYEGTRFLQSTQLLPFEGVRFFHALFTSVLMNTIFGPTMMAFHRVSDHYIETFVTTKKAHVLDSVEAVNWRKFTSFVLFKTLPLFWIPAHTITFLLDEGYRVFFASILGIMLGLILGFAKRK